MFRSRFATCSPPSLERALFLAKEAGIFTTKEIQTHFVKSPSFSTLKSPFLLEDFFSSSDRTDPAIRPKPQKSKPLEPESKPPVINKSNKASELIHQSLSRAFNPDTPTFVRNGLEFKCRAEGVGTRKRSVARAVILRGTGLIRVNGEQDFWQTWPLYYNRFDVLKPFLVSQTAGLFDLYLSVRGGGPSGQSGAARLAVARALVNACAELSVTMKDSLCLYEDTRQKISKVSGKKGAFARRKNKR